MGAEEHGAASGAPLLDEADHVARGEDVESGGRLVEDQDLGVVEGRAGDRDSLLLAGAQGLAAPLGEGVQVEGLHHAGDLVRQLGPVEPVQAAEVLERLARGQARVEAGGAREEAQALADLEGRLHDVVSRDPGGPCGGREDRGQHAQGGGLARAVGAEQTHDLARLALEVEAAHRGHLPALGVVEGLDQALGLDGGGRCAHEVVEPGSRSMRRARPMPMESPPVAKPSRDIMRTAKETARPA